MSKHYRVVVWGSGGVADAVGNAANASEHHDVIATVTSKDEVLGLDADCVVVAPEASADRVDDVLRLLESGRNVVTAVGLSAVPPGQLAQACRRGSATVHSTGIHAAFMAERMLLTVAQGPRSVGHITFVEARDLSRTSANVAALGFGGPLDTTDLDASTAAAGADFAASIVRVAHALHGAAPENVRIERQVRGLPARHDGGTVGVIERTLRGYLGDVHFFTNHEIWYLGKDNAYRGEAPPFGEFRGPLSYWTRITAEPTDVEMQWELDPTGHTDPATEATARLLLDAVAPVCDAEPGILHDDPSPRYHHDDRVNPPQPHMRSRV